MSLSQKLFFLCLPQKPRYNRWRSLPPLWCLRDATQTCLSGAIQKPTRNNGTFVEVTFPLSAIGKAQKLKIFQQDPLLMIGSPFTPPSSMKSPVVQWLECSAVTRLTGVLSCPLPSFFLKATHAVIKFYENHNRTAGMILNVDGDREVRKILTR